MAQFKFSNVFHFTKYISFKYFIASFLVGILFLYLIGPDTKKIYIYPNPNTINKAIFQDKTSQCFLYKEENVVCPSNKKDISTIPVQ